MVSEKAKAVQPAATLAMSKLAKDMQAEGIDVINLGVGESDFQTPKHIAEAAVSAIESNKTSFYTPTSGVKELKQAIVNQVAKRYQASIELKNVTVTTGAKLSLYVLMQTLLNPNDIVVAAAPLWVSYIEQIKLAGGIVRTIQPKNDELKLTVDDLEKISDHVKLIIVNSPTNPTGQVYSRQELVELLDWAKSHDTYIILDEIYGQLVYNGAVFTSGLQIKTLENSRMIIVDGVSKAYAMTGWRIGWTLASSEIITVMNKLLDHMTSNPTAVAQYAAIAALNGDQSSVEVMRLAFEKRLNTTFDLLNTVPGLQVSTKPQGAFYLFPKVSTEVLLAAGVANTSELSMKILEEAHVAMPSGEGFGMAGYLRMGYAKEQEVLNEAVRRLTVFFQQYI
ncbi:pyridoxal phosphate-dependent aminotransferase [Leuconostoc gasicomitatum]|uniref:pyridoxal phosphate-dependent aminotransferase n=1 Tax=Leuconostoc gasicomitatum TaxID=115778 RepID=UPI000BCB0C73|nr:pyridoxal phosphate-dependent aminotransferase [Leuconostoc gasicomitatum]MBZ5943709.1 pyridoxal phosphate-dependent aminotransferase [Leuconostoc gasicomitatum]MBZ5946729.1 pyridoxal phosphate-dependent aminotransferase [Leuconostoc gasicomitatum]MBZ5949997.1 pyridoxal phosphate-dependent aminotransferase [Leuconostoc gasicomitatum]MBZ5951640.1 pyridoxal phosphate-dependent aminotransferase [Leuconostoc gasicomitatum]MBZ5968611.1 pyridoxal phosphate-dependent aminotransferase [Leuconostoc 